MLSHVLSTSYNDPPAFLPVPWSPAGALRLPGITRVLGRREEIPLERAAWLEAVLQGRGSRFLNTQ